MRIDDTEGKQRLIDLCNYLIETSVLWNKAQFGAVAGLDSSRISKYTSGETMPSEQVLLSMADNLEQWKVNVQRILSSISRAWFIYGEGDMIVSDNVTISTSLKNSVVNSGSLSGEQVQISGGEGNEPSQSTGVPTEVAILQQRIQHLEALLAEKDRRIADKDELINLLRSQTR